MIRLQSKLRPRRPLRSSGSRKCRSDRFAIDSPLQPAQSPGWQQLVWRPAHTVLVLCIAGWRRVSTRQCSKHLGRAVHSVTWEAKTVPKLRVDAILSPQLITDRKVLLTLGPGRLQARENSLNDVGLLIGLLDKLVDAWSRKLGCHSHNLSGARGDLLAVLETLMRARRQQFHPPSQRMRQPRVTPRIAAR